MQATLWTHEQAENGEKGTKIADFQKTALCVSHHRSIHLSIPITARIEAAIVLLIRADERRNKQGCYRS